MRRSSSSSSSLGVTMTTALRFHRSESPDCTPEELLGFLREHTSDVDHISCEETVSDEHVEELCSILRVADTNLRVLRLPNNELTPDAARVLATVLDTNTTLEELDLRNNLLGPAGATHLSEPLCHANHTLKRLVLDHNRLGAKGSSPVARVLRHNETIEELHLGGNDFGVRGIKTLVKGVNNHHHSLHRLHLAHNNLKSRGVGILVEFLKTQRLHFLDLTCNQAGTTGAHAIAEWLLFDRALKTIWLGSNALGPAGGHAFRSVLQFHSTLQELRLGNNQMGNEGVLALSEGLRQNNSLVLLELDYNQIGDEGAVALATALRTNATLEVLSLNHNNVREGCVALAETLPYSLRLRELYLAHNRMDDHGAHCLADALVRSVLERLCWEGNHDLSSNELEKALRYRTNSRRWLTRWLERLRRNELLCLNWFSNTLVGDYELQSLATVLPDTTRLASVFLGGPHITSHGVSRLADATPIHLTRLFIRDCNMGDEGAAALGRAMRTNQSLKTLSLTSSHITAVGAERLAAGLSHNTCLRRLNLSRNEVGDEGFCHLVRKCSHLTSLNLMGNGVTAPAVWDMLVRHDRLQELHLQDNALTDRAILGFCQALSETCPASLVHLSLSGNPITAKGIQGLADFLPPKTHLQYN